MREAMDLIEAQIASVEKEVAEWKTRVEGLLAIGIEYGTEKPLIAMYEHGMRVGQLQVYRDIQGFFTRLDRENDQGVN